MAGNKWTTKLDTLLREYYERGFSDQAIADALEMETGAQFTRHQVRHRAEELHLVKGTNGEALFERPRRFDHLVLDKLRDGTRVLVAYNDMQIPFHDQASIRGLLRFTQDFEPTLLVAPGDGFDFYGWSDFDKNPSRQFDLQAELDIGRRVMRDIELATPKADRYWVDGNHEDRLRRWLWKNGQAAASLRSLDPVELMGLADWTYLPYGSSVNVMGVVIEHGEGSTRNMAQAMFNRRGTSGICGHSHRLRVINVTNASGEHTYIENGCLCSLKPEFVARPDWQQAFTYGIVVDGRLRLFPVRIDRDGFRAEGQWYRRRE